MSAPTIRNNSAAWGLFESPAVNTIPQPQLGNYIVVFVFNTVQETTGVTDSAGNTYTAKVQKGDANSNWMNLFTAPVTATGSGTLTVSCSGGGGCLVVEVTGNVSSTPDDGTGSGTFSSSSSGLLSASSISTTVATDLILSAGVDQNNATMTANTGTLIVSGTVAADTCLAQAHTTSSTGSYVESINMSASSANTSAIVAIAIKGTSSGTTATPPAGSITASGNQPTVTPATSMVIAPITAERRIWTPPERKIFLPTRLKRAA